MIKFVVYVTEPREAETGIGGTQRRFEFESGDAAWDCYAAAVAAGFVARGVKVKARDRELVSA